jgi:DNA-binding NtrC family response regulator
MRHVLPRELARLGYAVEVVGNGDDAVARWLGAPFDVAVLALELEPCDGLAALGRIRAGDPDAVVVLMTAPGTRARAVEAMHTGAADFVTRPFAIDELDLRLRLALGRRRAARERVADDHYEAARLRFDRSYFSGLLMRCGGCITEAAQRSGISRGHLHRRLRELGCDAAAARQANRANAAAPEVHRTRAQ